MTYVYCDAQHHLSALSKDAWKGYDENEECMICGWDVYIDLEGYYFQYDKGKDDKERWQYEHVDCFERNRND